MNLTAADMAERRRNMLKAAFHLFSEQNIDSVTMGDIAAQTDYTLRSLHRYFSTKDELVVAVAIWAWNEYTRRNRRRVKRSVWDGMTGAQRYEFFLDSFLDLYRNHADLLRFNQMFNIHVRAMTVDGELLRPYHSMIADLRSRFGALHQKGIEDGTLRADASEEEMFSTSLHLMLAATTRYAVGLVYQGGTDPEQELQIQKELLLARYTESK